MARPTGGGASRNSRGARPSVQELMNTLATSTFGDEFSGVTVSATKAEFSSMTQAWLDNSQSMDYYDPKKYNNLAETSAGVVSADEDTLRGRQFYEVVDLTGELIVPGYSGPQNEEDTSPAELTLVPTSSSNPERPRTVAAGYDEDEEKLTVMFRDGTLYNYYEVTPNEWAAFKANRSKGAVIYRLLDFKPRGYADDSTMSKNALPAFYRYSRGIQVVKGGDLTGQKRNTYKTATNPQRSKKR